MSAQTATQAQARTRHEPSAWLRDQLNGLGHRWAAGEVFGCPHLHKGARFAPLWAPQFIACIDCLGRITPDPRERPCDRCHRAAFPDIHASYTPHLGIQVLYSLCGDCDQKETAQ